MSFAALPNCEQVVQQRQLMVIKQSEKTRYLRHETFLNTQHISENQDGYTQHYCVLYCTELYAQVQDEFLKLRYVCISLFLIASEYSKNNPSVVSPLINYTIGSRGDFFEETIYVFKVLFQNTRRNKGKIEMCKNVLNS